MKHFRRILVALVIATSIATTASATLPPVDSSQGPWACYRIIWPDRWFFVAFYWEDVSCTLPRCFDNIVCFYRY